MPGLSFRALGSSLTLVFSKPVAHVRADGFAGTFPPLPQAEGRLALSGHGPTKKFFATFLSRKVGERRHCYA